MDVSGPSIVFKTSTTAVASGRRRRRPGPLGELLKPADALCSANPSLLLPVSAFRMCVRESYDLKSISQARLAGEDSVSYFCVCWRSERKKMLVFVPVA